MLKKHYKPEIADLQTRVDRNSKSIADLDSGLKDHAQRMETMQRHLQSKLEQKDIAAFKKAVDSVPTKEEFLQFDERMTARFKNQDSRIDQSHLVTLECKDIILRYDEVICDKAQKWEVVEVK